MQRATITVSRTPGVMQQPRLSAKSVRCRPSKRTVQCAATPNIPPVNDQGTQASSTKPVVRTLSMSHYHSPHSRRPLCWILHAVGMTYSKFVCCPVGPVSTHALLLLVQVVEPRLSVAAQLNNAWKHQWDHLMDEVMPDERVSLSARNLERRITFPISLPVSAAPPLPWVASALAAMDSGGCLCWRHI